MSNEDLKSGKEAGHVIPDNDVERKISLELTGLEWWKVVETLQSQYGRCQFELSNLADLPDDHPAKTSYISSAKMIEEILEKLKGQIGY